MLFHERQHLPQRLLCLPRIRRRGGPLARPHGRPAAPSRRERGRERGGAAVRECKNAAKLRSRWDTALEPKRQRRNISAEPSRPRRHRGRKPDVSNAPSSAPELRGCTRAKQVGSTNREQRRALRDRTAPCARRQNSAMRSTTEISKEKSHALDCDTHARTHQKLGHRIVSVNSVTHTHAINWDTSLRQQAVTHTRTNRQKQGHRLRQ